MFDKAPHFMLADSGFTGHAIIGDESTGDFETRASPLSIQGGRRSYVFGAGEQMKAEKCLEVKVQNNWVKFDVLPGKLGAIVGRKYLKQNKIVLDFESDEITTAEGRYSPAHLLPTREEAATGENTETPGDTNSFPENSVNVDGQKAPVHSDAPTTDNVFISSVLLVDLDGEDECDCFYDDVNIFQALHARVLVSAEEREGAEKRSIEDQILEQWAKDARSGARPSGVRQFWDEPHQNHQDKKAVEKKHQKAFSKAPLACRSFLVDNFPAKVWSLSPSAIASFHRLRHAPAGQMIKFFIAATPVGSRETSEFQVWKRSLIFWCEKVVRSCPGCQLNSRRFHRPGAVPRVWDLHEAGMMDLMVLDSSTKTCALVVVDLCSGQPMLKLVNRKPPDSESVFNAYVDRCASVRGAHRHLAVDRDGIFRSELSGMLYEHLRIKTDVANSHEQLAMAERMIETVRFSLDRTRDSDGLPETDDEWNFYLCVLENCLANEVNRSGTSPAIREFGMSTSLTSNLLTDTTVSGSSLTQKRDKLRHIKLAEAARENFRQVLFDDKLRDLLSMKVFDHEAKETIEIGDLVTFWRERDSGRNVSSRVGPAKVLGFDPTTRRYILEHRGAPIYADCVTVRKWDNTQPVDDRDIFELAEPGQPAPPPTSGSMKFATAEEATEYQRQRLAEYHPPAPGPKIQFSSDNPLIHRPAHERSDAEITCPKCKNHASHHSHTKRRGCRLEPSSVDVLLTQLAVQILGGGLVQNLLRTLTVEFYFARISWAKYLKRKTFNPFILKCR